MVAGGGVSMSSDWAPSGSHFLFATNRYGGWAIEDMSFKERFTRRLFEVAVPGGVINDPRWAPDGMRFVFTLNSSAGRNLMLSNAAGGRLVELDREAGAAAWSPDGQWIAYQRIQLGKRQLAKIRPGSTPVPLASIIGTRANKDQTQWSPAGDWILFNTPDGFSLISPEGNNERTLTTRKFLAYGFSKDGRQFLGIFQNTNPDGAEWQLYSVDVKTSAEKLIGAVDLPVSTNTIRGFSLNPDGKSFLTSIAKWPFDIWMLEGWDEQPTGLSRLFRRKAPAPVQPDSQP
jgi:Tol biopolymer transport system component